ncbi:plexin-B-like [Dermacentor variabilis]|uniref:plexin-B-like n=1 Tax=Dermacentor variabilis TaxID=34621 RepID=UPI003F5B8E5A
MRSDESSGRRSARRACRPSSAFTRTAIGLALVASLVAATVASAAVLSPPDLKKSSPPQQLRNVLASYTTFNETVNFTHFVVDAGTGRVYVGATNWLYQFNASLELEASVQTGPVEDSVLCSPSDCSGVEAEPTDNINKVLVIDYKTRKLIACGSIHQGACRRHDLDDITQQEALVSVPVAANDRNSSTYAFVGPAHYHGGRGPMRVMYVATTNSRQGPYRDMVPSICSRSLDEPGGRRGALGGSSDQPLFAIIEQSFSATARVDIANHIKDYYLVHYVYGFHTEHFAYFATVQRKSHLRASEELGYVSRLARVCTSDPAYSTYTEVTLQCLGPDGTDYNLLTDAGVMAAGEDVADELGLEPGSSDSRVLVGLFVVSADHTTRPSRRSAVCLFAMTDVEQKFTENVHMCYNGSVLTRNMDYIAGSINQCPEPGKAGNIINFCNETVKLNGSVPISAKAAITYPNDTLTSLATVLVGHHNVLFVGTAKGTLRKILITGATAAEEFEQVPLDPGHKIIPQINVDAAQNFLFAVSVYKVSKVRIEKCQLYETCESCLASRNPFCGWCSLERRCTVKAHCQNATGTLAERSSSARWLSLGSNKCIDFLAVRPEQLPYKSMSMVDLVINQLPQLPYGAHYLCVYGSSAPIQARVTHLGLACMSPLVAARPPIVPGRDHVIVDLAVRSSETDTDFIHREFAFFDCSVHKTCKSCVMSSWPCNWCLHENFCTSNATDCARRVIIGESNSHNSLIKGRQHCPSFSIDDEILLPHEARKEIAVEVRNILTPLEGFQCVVEIEGARERVFARLRDNKVICTESTYTYQAEQGELQASLTVLWNGDTFIDKTNVTLYKCLLLGSHGGRQDCSLCLTRDKRYQCSWCGGSCNYGPSCVEPVTTSCPPPRIDWIHPLNGPVEGGTLVTIEGSNLGTSEEEIRDKILVGGLPCVPVEYNVSVRVVCRTQPSPHGAQATYVVIGNRAGITKAQEKFHYKPVELTGVQPRVGPQSGGTRLYLNGTNLNVGSHVSVYLDDIVCHVERSLASSSQISCRTSRSLYPSYQVSQLILRIDGANLTLSNPFFYTEDPSLHRIQPLKSFLSGGRHIHIYGTNLTSIQQPRMAVFNRFRQVNETSCHVLNASVMVCPSPAVLLRNPGRDSSFDDEEEQAESADVVAHAVARGQHQRNTAAKSRGESEAGSEGDELDAVRLRIGFIMDDVRSVQELNKFYPDVASDLTYVSDPRFFPFDNDGVKLYKGEPLVIEGEMLRLATTESEINVTIGTRPCNLTSLSMSQLVCVPPDVQPPSTDEIGHRTEMDLPVVVVRVGSNLRYEVGYLRYEVAKIYEFPPETVGAIAAGGTVLMLLSLVTLAILKHKNSQAEREYKRIQLQMDTLENSVRSECKQAFAELQTDMTDLNNDIQATGIPTLDHKAYIMKVFFPGVPNSPILQEVKQINGPYNNYEVAMTNFEMLINNKSFLLTFIDTLENQNTFSIRDKVNVASLLMIILLDKMEYATDILRELLIRLVEKYVGTKHPQLMLRRTESVVEKMLTNWMALCMYGYIKEHAGRSLFLLFSAIKHQVEKGPVDAVTHDARYSLSEERLLREQIEYSTVVIQVVQEDQDEKVFCRVNDCDTISQVKAKVLDALYKNTPCSMRPLISEVDLEWRHGRGGHLILQDEDLTTKTVSGCQKLNTLAHYGIHDSAIMSLVNKKRRYCKNGTATYGPISTLPARNNNYEGHYGSTAKYWHLVKPLDDRHESQQDQRHKSIPEIFLTRLLSTKGTIQKFVDDFLHNILTVNEALPCAVKWLFDLLDTTASTYGIVDAEVCHAWKSNSLPLRFWVNLVKNPDFIFDIEKTPILDACLSVIAQTFMDACSTTEHRLGKDSPSNKLLFARDIPSYRRLVCKFYQDVAALPPVSDQDMRSAMHALSVAHAGEVDVLNALKELYIYVTKYSEQILEALEDDEACQELQLAQRLETVACTLSAERTLPC